MEKLSLPETVTVAELSPKPVPPPTKKEIGKARRAFITRSLSTVIACGHKFDTERTPHNHCEHCWYAYWKTSSDLEEIRKELTENGSKGLEAKYGKVFTKQFRKFLDAELKGEYATSSI